jgi:hypothetical protein
MSRTEVRSRQIKDGGVKREDLNVDTPGRAVTRKIVAGQDISISSTGVDSGTGDVTVNYINRYPKNYIERFQYSYVNTSTVRIVAGSCRDNQDTHNIISETTNDVNLNNSGVNGLDTGTKAANTWYYLYVISDSSGINATSGIFSSNSTIPTLPSGYDKFRRIGSVRNGAENNIIRFTMQGNTERTTHYDASFLTTNVLQSGSSTTFVTLGLSSFVSLFSVISLLSLTWQPASGGNEFCYLRPNGSSSDTNLKRMSIPSLIGTATINTSGMYEMETNESQQIQYRVTGSSNINISVIGYKEMV